MLKFRLISVQILTALGVIVLSACGATPATEIPTMTTDPNIIRTEAVSTFAADLTLTAFAAPTSTATMTSTPAVTLSPLATNTGSLGFGATAPAATGSCYAMAYVKDVTIPDNTQVTPGQSFTKTWQIKNAGTCQWDAGFKFTFLSGDAMSGATYTLPSPVAAGAVVDISVPMIAPSKTGTVRGDWRMTTASGQAIPGIVYVQVIVGGSGATTAPTTGATTAATTAAPTTAVPPTVSPTP